MHVHCFKLQLEVWPEGPQNIILTVFFNFWAPRGFSIPYFIMISPKPSSNTFLKSQSEKKSTYLREEGLGMAV